MRAKENAPLRKAYKAERYNSEYKATRKRWAIAINAGISPLCPRCNEPVGKVFDLDHIDGGLFPAHPACNRSHMVPRT